jgi:hypothetical protein
MTYKDLLENTRGLGLAKKVSGEFNQNQDPASVTGGFEALKSRAIETFKKCMEEVIIPRFSYGMADDYILPKFDNCSNNRFDYPSYYFESDEITILNNYGVEDYFDFTIEITKIDEESGVTFELNLGYNHVISEERECEIEEFIEDCADVLDSAIHYITRRIEILGEVNESNLGLSKKIIDKKKGTTAEDKARSIGITEEDIEKLFMKTMDNIIIPKFAYSSSDEDKPYMIPEFSGINEPEEGHDFHCYCFDSDADLKIVNQYADEDGAYFFIEISSIDIDGDLIVFMTHVGMGHQIKNKHEKSIDSFMEDPEGVLLDIIEDSIGKCDLIKIQDANESRTSLGLAKKVQREFSEEDKMADINDTIAEDLMTTKDFHNSLEKMLNLGIPVAGTDAYTGICYNKWIENDDMRNILSIEARSFDDKFDKTEGEVNISFGLTSQVGYSRRVPWVLDQRSWKDFSLVFNDASPGSERYMFKTTKRFLLQVAKLFKMFIDNKDLLFEAVFGEISKEKDPTNVLLNMKPRDLRRLLKPVLHTIIEKELTNK